MTHRMEGQLVNDYKPTPKVTATMVGGAFAAIVVWALNQFASIEVPGEIAAAVAVVAGYMTPEK